MITLHKADLGAPATAGRGAKVSDKKDKTREKIRSFRIEFFELLIARWIAIFLDSLLDRELSQE